MTIRGVDLEKTVIRLTLPRLVALLVFVGGGGWWAALKLQSIDSRLAALQASGWTIQDQERQMNWLKWDNVGAVNLKVREAREVVAARTPAE